jgi:hypothetical protein
MLEDVGTTPDVAAHLTAGDVAAHRDAILIKAVGMLSGGSANIKADTSKSVVVLKDSEGGDVSVDLPLQGNATWSASVEEDQLRSMSDREGE